MNAPASTLQLRTEVEIEADVRAVWGVLTNLASYRDWNPFLVNAAGDLKPGAAVHLVANLEGDERSAEVRVGRCEPEVALSFVSRRLWGWGLHSEHFFELRPLDEHRTRLIQGENARGALLKHLGPTMTLRTRGFVGMNQALKRRVETMLLGPVAQVRRR